MGSWADASTASSRALNATAFTDDVPTSRPTTTVRPAAGSFVIARQYGAPQPMRSSPRSSHLGTADAVLSDDVVAAVVVDRLLDLDVRGRSVCVVVPDSTRTCPVPLLTTSITTALTAGGASRISFLVALGTHAPMSEAALAAHVPIPPALDLDGPTVTVDNHRWWDPTTFVDLGTISSDRVAELSGGRLRREVPVRVNRAVVDHDLTVLVGPVFPHEVVGFSGGNKYLFPGLSGPEMIDVSHWLGALIGSAEIIGTPGPTPVRDLIDDAASLVPAERVAVCVVSASGGGLHSVSIGAPADAWADAVVVSAEAHVRYLDRPVARVLSLVPPRYDDMWTGAKGFYKVEPVVADGGRVVLHAPHITQVSAMHPGLLEIGYHVRDYFLGQWDRFAGHPWGELAHSTHLRGVGTWDPATGEHPRVQVTLATGIDEATVRSVGLDHLDPSSIDIDAWRADPDTLIVDDAGEHLYRLI
jgi:nickel-dependent lactate racemase